MLRFLARTLGAVLLAVAVIYAVGDIARSIADDAVMLTSLDGALSGLGLAVPAGTAATGAAEVPPAGELASWFAGVMGTLGPLPAAVVAFALALVLLLVGQPRRDRQRLNALRER